MSTINKLETEAQTIYLGRQGEHNILTLTFSLDAFKTAYGAGMAILVYRSAGDTRPYLPDTTFDVATSVLSWTVQSRDTYYAGSGKAEVRWLTSAGNLKKSAIFETSVVASIMDTTAERPGNIVYMGDITNVVEKDDLDAYDIALREAMLQKYVESDVTTWVVADDDETYIAATIKRTSGETEYEIEVPSKWYVDNTFTRIPQEEPEAAQVLASDGAGGYYWKTVIKSDGSGTATIKDYDEVSNKPKINGHTLQGDSSPAQLGMADAEHTHKVADITDFPDSLKNPYALTIYDKFGRAQEYDGSAAVTAYEGESWRLIREITMPTYAQAIADTTSGITWVTSSSAYVTGFWLDTDSDGKTFAAKSLMFEFIGGNPITMVYPSQYGLGPNHYIGVNNSTAAQSSSTNSVYDTTSNDSIGKKKFRCLYDQIDNEIYYTFSRDITHVYPFPTASSEIKNIAYTVYPGNSHYLNSCQFTAGVTLKIWIEE